MCNCAVCVCIRLGFPQALLLVPQTPSLYCLSLCFRHFLHFLSQARTWGCDYYNLTFFFFFQLESSCVSIHEVLKVVIESQTWLRLREAHDRMKAEHLLERVTLWSIGETTLLFVIGIGQVMLLRSFFTDNKGSVGTSTWWCCSFASHCRHTAFKAQYENIGKELIFIFSTTFIYCIFFYFNSTLSLQI